VSEPTETRPTETDGTENGDTESHVSGARTEFPLDEWSTEDRALLDRLLTGEDIPHVWQGGTVSVPVGSQYVVDELIDQVEMSAVPGAPAEADEPGAAVVTEEGWAGDDEGWDDDVDAQEVLGTAFLAADRLARRSSDPEGVLALVEVHGVMATMTLPFGFDPAVWSDLVARTGVIATALAADDDEDQPTGERLEELAEDLRARLRPLV
jgi:hypothetical protein